jgi:hypothetical protein
LLKCGFPCEKALARRWKPVYHKDKDEKSTPVFRLDLQEEKQWYHFTQ